MNKMLLTANVAIRIRVLTIILLSIVLINALQAQLTGIKNIPGNYATLALAIADLNAQGVGAGGVTLNLLAANPQSVPAGGYVIGDIGSMILAGANATSSTKQVLIQGNGNTLTASGALTVGNVNDGIFKLIGADWITIQGFTMQENAGNVVNTPAASNNMTEWGVALLYVSTTDGAQENTIQNNTISLNRSYANTFGVYSNVRHSPTDPLTAADIIAPTGANSSNNVFSNNINNVNFGITMIGSSVPANMDLNNDLGGSALATGNTISNWGGAGQLSAFISNTTVSYCVFLNHQVGSNIAFNTLTSAAVNYGGTFLGIYSDYTVAAPVGTFGNNISNNTVTMTNSFVGAATQIQCIRHSSAIGATATATANIENNTILNCAITGAASAITLFGVLNTAPFGTVNVNSNIVVGTTSTATTAGIVGVTSQGAVVNAVNLNNNQCGNAGGNFISFSAATSGAVNAVTCSLAAATATVSISNNDVRGILFGALSTSGPLLISSSSICLNHVLNNNTFTNLTLNTTGGTTFISSSTALPSTGSRNVNNNSIVTAFNKTGAGGTITFYTTGSFSVNGSTNIANNNNFSNITVTGATTIGGWINAEGNTATDAPAKTFTGNIFNNITGGTSGITLASFSFGGNTSNISNNTITNITGQGAISGIVLGSSNNGLTVSNNTITNLSSTGVGGIVTGISTSASGALGAAINSNSINTLSSSGASSTIFGISVTGGTTVTVGTNTIHTLSGSGITSPLIRGVSVSAGTTINVSKNKIYNLSENAAISTTVGAVNGLLISGGGTSGINVSNNLIGDLRTPAANLGDAIRGINITSATALSTINIYFNTININAQSTGANFGSSGIFHTFNTTATTATLDLRNNIIVNNSTPNGSGVTVAFRRSAATNLNNYATTSNNNLFWAGGTGACTTRFIYHDGVAGLQMGPFQTLVTPRETASVTEDPPFLSTNGTLATFLHINPAIATQIEAGAVTIGSISDDFDGNARAGTPDIGADEYSGTVDAACAGTPTAGTAAPGTSAICSGQSITICLSGQTSATGITTQWQSATVSGGPYTDINCAGGSCYTTGALTPGTYFYRAIVTCLNSGISAPSNQVTVTVNPNPIAAIMPSAPTVCQGVPVALTASGGTTYTWSPSTGLNMNTGAMVIATPAMTTTYTVTVTDANLCSATAAVTVTVMPSPTVMATATPASICFGANSQLNAVATLGVFPYSLSNLAGQTYTTLTGAGITIINTAAQLTPTMGSANQDDGGVVITLPFTFTYLGNSFTQMSMCTNGWVGAGNQGTIDALSMRTPGNLFVPTIPNNTIAAWFKDMGANFPIGTGSMRHGLIGTDVYAFQWDNAIGSGFTDGSAILISFQVNIYGPNSAAPGRIDVIYGPTVGAIAFAASEGIEDGTGGPSHYINAIDGSSTSTTLSTIWPGNGNGYRFTPIVPTFAWSPATFLNSTTISNPLASVVTAITTYTVTVTSGNGCTATSSVTVTPSPIVNFVVTQPITCISTEGAINLTVTPPGTYTYDWADLPGTNDPEDRTGLVAGTYNVTVTNTSNGCTNSLSIPLAGPGGCDVCPTIPNLTATPNPVCSGVNFTLNSTGLTSMGNTYGIIFKSFPAPTGTPYTGGTVLATVANGSLTSSGTVATATTSLATAGTYYVYAILTPAPTDPLCRPSATTTLVVNQLPSLFTVTGGGSFCANDNGVVVGLSGSQMGVNYQLRLNLVNTGAPVMGTGMAISFGNQSGIGTYTVVATSTSGGCTSNMTGSVTVATFNCNNQIFDPCTCLNNATTLTNGQFAETIKVNAPSTQTWTVTAVTGLYQITSPSPPAAPIPIAVGTVMTNLGPGMNMFILSGIHIDALGYTLTVSNAAGTSLSIGNSCQYPNPTITSDLSGDYCLFSDPVTLTGTPGDANIVSQGFTVNGAPATQFDPSAGVGQYLIVYTVDGGIPKAFGPNDPGCIQSVSTFVNVIATPTTVACNDLIQVSLDENCTAVISPSMVLSGAPGCYDDYIVEIDVTAPYGNGPWIPAILGPGDVGKTYAARVTHLVTNNSCWGLINVEDKIPPVIECSDVTLSCDELVDPVEPFASDACGPVTFTHTDTESGDPCDAIVVTRIWTATDVSGNAAHCTQNITIVPLTLDDVVCPAPYVGHCGDNTDPSHTGWPTAHENPITDENNVCNIFVGYWDKPLNDCGNGIKIVRTWTILDWCTQTTTKCTQVIKLIDDQPPIIKCPLNLTVGTDFWYCYANVSIPTPDVFDVCGSPWTLSLSATDGHIVNFGNHYVLNQVPLGTVYVTWTATDECGNSSSCTFTITVVDDVVPVANCDAHTVVALTNDGPMGITLVPAHVFDDGSYDNCGPVTFRVRRMESCINFDWTTGGACVDDIPNGQVNSVDRGVVSRPCVPFACCDVGAEDPIMVELEVTDAAGNKNFCMVEAVVQDKISPFVECPPDITVSCDFWFNVEEGTFTDSPINHEGNGNGNLDEDPLSPIFGNMYDAFAYNDDESVREDIWINDPGNPNVSQPHFWGIDGWADDNCEVNLQVRVRVVNDCSGDDLPSGAPAGAVKMIERRFSASDGNQGIAPGTCTQRIWVVDFDPFYISDVTCGLYNSDDVVWPCDVLLTACPEIPTATGEPIVYDDACSLIGVAYEDQRFNFVDGACYKILRTWSVIDWCQYNSLTGYGLWHYTQVIKVHDNEGPIFLTCPNEPQTLCVADDGVSLPDNNQAFLGEDNPLASSCSVHLNLCQIVHETCSDIVNYDVKLFLYNEDEFIYVKNLTSIEVDSNHNAALCFDTRQNSSFQIRQNGIPYNSPFCGDYHRLLWSAEDGCGNWSHCEYLIRLEDCKQPSPVCINGLSTVVMPIGGQVTIWAKDFNASSFDDCTPEADLLYSFSGDNYQPSFTYTCDNVPSFGVELSVNIWVADGGTDDNCNGSIGWGERNKDFCTTTIVITDNVGVCPDTSGSILLAGEILTEDVQSVEKAAVTLTSPGHVFPTYVTVEDGKYSFFITPADYTVKVERNDAFKNGVSTLDLVRIQKHLLGIEAITNPYDLIAADANNSETVSAIDLIELRKLILGIYTELPANKSWRFVDKSFQFADPTHPWPFAEEINVSATTNHPDEDFVAIKVGDVNNTVQANVLQVLPRNGKGVVNFVANERIVNTGEMVDVAISSTDFAAIEGYQFTLQTQGLEFRGVESGLVTMSDENLGVFGSTITASWHKVGGVSATASEVLFTLQFQATAPGKLSSMIVLNSKETEAEAYNTMDDIKGLKLTFRGAEHGAEFALYQNEPNPFKGNTVIGYDLPEAGKVTLTLFDVTGKVLLTRPQDGVKGYNTISVSSKEMPAVGVLYYRLDANQYSATKKMVIIE